MSETNRELWLPWITSLILCLGAASGSAQPGDDKPGSTPPPEENPVPPEVAVDEAEAYEWPTDPQVRAKLERWRDLKFGVIIHWGLYAVPGIVESWTLCQEDWINRPPGRTYEEYKSWYWGLANRFDPRGFDPAPWAKAARNAGMRYLVFTTKHHDGFCLFDTDQTSFKVTQGPFSDHPRADVTEHVFKAFRDEGFMIGAYFSKPDWHSQDFWWNEFPTPNRNVNYDPREYPRRWNRFKKFTARQIDELLTGYGSIDILWLDGGWIRPRDTITKEVLSWGAPIPEWDQSLDLSSIAAHGRKNQPGLLIVDRTVHGEFENYRTPERRIPKEALPYPWESCIPLANNWGYVPNDRHKTATQVVHSLIEVVAKGGNLLLGVGPRADGTLDEKTLGILSEIGNWMDTNAPALHRTRAVSPHRDGEAFFTRGRDGGRFAILRIPEGRPIPSTVSWAGNHPAEGSILQLLGREEPVRWQLEGNRTQVTVPLEFRSKNEGWAAIALRYEPAE